ncbi:MAG: aminoacyl-tRNA hydrolase [Chlamydiota bacterium]
MTEKRLIVGLGNPGAAYVGTRHNIGFRVVQSFAEEKGFHFRQTTNVKGELAQGSIGELKIFCLMPATYMNHSGEAVRLCLDYFDIPIEHLMVVVDDVDLPFGKIRLRPQGSAGGHNGLKSIKEHIKTLYYSRLRIGIADREHGDLADYVLGRFSAEESGKLPEIVKQAALILDTWILNGINVAMQSANQEGEKNG